MVIPVPALLRQNVTGCSYFISQGILHYFLFKATKVSRNYLPLEQMSIRDKRAFELLWTLIPD
jgi:hypothetical protein